MKLAAYLAIVVMLMFVESFLSIEFVKPDLGLPLIVYATLYMSPLAGFISAVVVGLFQEILSSAPNGSILFTKTSLFLIIAFLQNHLYMESRFSFAGICAGFVVVESLAFLILSLLSRGEATNAFNVFFYLFPNMVFTGVFGMITFSAIDYINERYLDRG
jgi:cell shape-determining protein MreD